MGRTQAGKSTLIEALSAGSGDRIGDGRQRFSRDVCVRPIVNLPGVAIVDTPGVGAHDGDEDRQLAFEQLPHADLVVWVGSNNSFQEEAAQALRLIAVYGKPVVVVLNCRYDLLHPIRRDDFLKDPRAAFRDVAGDLNAVLRHLARAGARPAGVVTVHAQAAFLGTQDHPDAALMWAHSDVAKLLAVLAEERDRRADQRRAIAFVDRVRNPVIRYLATLDTATESLGTHLEQGEGLVRDLSQRVARQIDRQHELLAAELDGIIESRRSWHASADVESDLNAAWRKEMSSLNSEMEQAGARHHRDLTAGLEVTISTVLSDWTNLPTPNVPLGEFTGFGSVWLNRASQAAVGLGAGAAAWVGGALLGGKVGGLLGIEGGPPLMAVTAVVGAVIGGLVATALGPVKDGLARLFLGSAEVLRRRRAELGARIHPILDDLQSEINQWREETRAATQSAMRTQFEAMSGVLAGQRSIQRWWCEVGTEINEAVGDLDAATARTLLRLSGRTGLAEEVLRARREPGSATAVEYTREGFSQAALFPPDESCELMLATGPAKPGVRAGQALSLAIGLSAAAPRTLRLTDRQANIHIEEPIPSGLTDTWSSLFSLFTASQVRITTPAPDHHPASCDHQEPQA
ncbi:GTPase [Terracoccus luteus]|nr:GTPase [Terracoccus luteus]